MLFLFPFTGLSSIGICTFVFSMIIFLKWKTEVLCFSVLLTSWACWVQVETLPDNKKAWKIETLCPKSCALSFYPVWCNQRVLKSNYLFKTKCSSIQKVSILWFHHAWVQSTPRSPAPAKKKRHDLRGNTPCWGRANPPVHTLNQIQNLDQ